MDLWSLEHRVFAFECFVTNGESVTVVQREFRRRFGIDRHGHVPSRNTILKWVKHLRTKGSLLKTKPSGPPRVVRTQENVERVRLAMVQSPGRSARRLSAELQVSDRSVRRILKAELHFHPYKIALVSKVKDTDYPKRLRFAQVMSNLMEENENIILLMSDEAHFHLDGAVNKQNCRYWAPVNPQKIHEKPLHSPKVTVWCAVGKDCIIGPYFFEENDSTVTVNAERYVEMLNTFLLPELRRRRIPARNVWFQQDGASSHTAHVTMNILRRVFPNRVVSRFGDVEWPPRSPDLSKCDFFLWGYLKARVYIERPRTLCQLKEKIRQEINLIAQDMLLRVEASFTKRLQECENGNGHHLMNVIFHK